VFKQQFLFTKNKKSSNPGIQMKNTPNGMDVFCFRASKTFQKFSFLSCTLNKNTAKYGVVFTYSIQKQAWI